MTLNKREKIMALITALVALGALAWIFIVDPLLSGWEKQESRIQYLSDKADLMRKSLGEEEALMSRYSLVAENVSMGEKPEKTPRLLLEKSGALAKEEGIVVRGLSPLPPQHYDFYSRISVRMEIECTLEQLVKALYRIKTGDGSFEVTSMEIAPRDRNSNILRGHLELTATVMSEGGEEASDGL